MARPVFDAEINVLGSLNVLEGARQAAPARSCSRRAAGRSTASRTRPSSRSTSRSPQRPLSPYGVAKKVGDYLHAYRELHGLEYTSLALANVYGPRQDPHGEAGVVAIFAGNLLAGEPCTVFGDGEQTRDYVYVDDVVDAFVRAADKGSGLLCNIGTGVETSVPSSTGHGRGGRRHRPPVRRRPVPASCPQRRSTPAAAAIHLGWSPPGPTVPTGAAAVLATLLAHHVNVPGTSNRGRSAEEVFVGGADDLGVDLARRSQLRIDAPHDGDGHAGGLAHHELGRAGELVDDAHLGDLHLAAVGVLGAAQVDDAPMPAQPMATSVRPRRHVRPNVSDTITATSTPARA